MSLYRAGFEKPVQFAWPGGQVIVSGGAMAAFKSEEFPVLVTPADCGHDAVPAAFTQFPGGALACGVPTLCVSTPEEARASLCAMVLLTMFTFNASCNEIPAPSQPATLLTMMLLVMVTSCQYCGSDAKVPTSVPLTCWRRMPPPLPVSAKLP